MSNIKIQKYESLIQKIVSETISKSVRNPLIQLASIHYVKLSNDKSLAKIYISCYDKTKLDKLLLEINKFSGIFKSALAKNLKIYKTPSILFLKDESMERVEEINQILDNLKRN